MTLKLNGSSSGSVALDAPASTTSGADITFKLPVADGIAGQVLQTDGSGNLSWVTPGITHISQYRQNANTTIGTYSSSGYNYLTANWEKPDNANGIEFTNIGTDVSESSGVFTYPATGFWRVEFHLHCNNSGNRVDEAYAYINATNDNGTTWHDIGAGGTSMGTTYSAYKWGVSHAIQDVEDVGQDKVRFRTTASQNSFTLLGSTSSNNTYVTFTRLCDT